MAPRGPPSALTPDVRLVTFQSLVRQVAVDLFRCLLPDRRPGCLLTVDSHTADKPVVLHSVPPATPGAQAARGRAATSGSHQLALGRARAAGHPVGADLGTVPTGAVADPSVPMAVTLAAVLTRAGVRPELVQLSARLLVEYSGRLSMTEVLRCVAGCSADLRGSGLSGRMPEALERLARQRLRRSH